MNSDELKRLQIRQLMMCSLMLNETMFNQGLLFRLLAFDAWLIAPQYNRMWSRVDVIKRLALLRPRP